MSEKYNIGAGTPAPLGATVLRTGVNFALFSAHASAVTLCLFSKTGVREIAQIPLSAKTGNIWHGFVQGLQAGQLYGYRVDGPYAPHEGHRFNRHKLLIDPYAKQLFGDFILDDALYGFDKTSPAKDLSFNTQDSARFMPKCVVGDVEFDWSQDIPPQTDLSDTILYECHVKGATMLNPDVPKRKRGTAEGLSSAAMIKHLRALGVTAVEILPAQSFFTEPRLQDIGLTNYWGYNPVNYFAPHTRYLGPAKSKSIQTMVKALHAANIEVILDVVYNHTAESWELGPTLSYRGIDNKSYYHLQDDARYYENYTGCGNALNMAHPAVLDLTIASLRHWVEVYHIDGFRFDLGPTMGRNPADFDREAGFFKALASDPVLSKVKFIAEPWDIGPGGYQLGGFPNGWSEWNDQYRDTVRGFWRGDAGAHKDLAGRLLGSAANFDHDERNALSSVNFITSHDGFTLHDTVSYNDKHNHANGEDNRDGHGHNLSNNMGVEGPTDNPQIIEARRTRKINMLATLLLSQGVPMLLAGDEFGQSQSGNNNAYCQDNETTWLDWSANDGGLQKTVADLIRLRQKFPHFRQRRFLHGEAIDETHSINAAWINASGQTMTASQWDQDHEAALGLLLSTKPGGSVLIIINRGQARKYSLPLCANWTVEFSAKPAELHTHHCTVPSDCVVVLYSPSLAVPRDVYSSAIDEHAKRAGIIPEYWDISRQQHIATDSSKAAILKAMDGSYHNNTAVKDNTNPQQVYGAKTLREQGGVWGLTAALYGLRSERNWGVGDFEDLACLAENMAKHGADFIGINPVHALFPSAANLYAPYSPSSRDFLNVIHIAPDKIDELTKADIKRLQKKLSAVRKTNFVDYEAVNALKNTGFELAFSRFKALPPTHKRRTSFQAFVKREAEPLRLHAIYDAIFETLPDIAKTYDGFKNFPLDLQSPDNPAVTKFAKAHCERVEYYAYLQWIAHAQLSNAQARAKAAGMSVGLYLDYAVGVVPGGSDVWRNREAYAQNISLGAPGDAANPDGQVWNLAPLNPHKLAANNFEPYRSSIRRIMRQAGAVRIDHVLGHMRSFWIPKDEACQGAYVRYPLDGLFEMIAQESQSAKCVVIGEDLGTVPDGLRRAMQARELMGCGIGIIERDESGQLLALDEAREFALMAFSNHDFPTLAGFWQGADFEWRTSLGISSDENVLQDERARRQRDINFLLYQIGEHDEACESLKDEIAAKLHAKLGRSPSLAVAVQLEELLLQTAQPNVPGTTQEQPNWRRKYTVDINTIAKSASARMILGAIQKARPRKEG